MGEDKELVLDLDRGEQAQLAAASAGAGVLDYARDAIFMAVQEDQALGVLAETLERYGEAFGLDPAANAARVARIRSRRAPAV
jgi:hypothetical protein